MAELPIEHETANPTPQQERYFFSPDRWMLLTIANPRYPLSFYASMFFRNPPATPSHKDAE